MRIIQKEQELAYLNVFKHLCKNFPDGLVRADETPDFIVTSNKASLGIEVTQLFLDSGKSSKSRQSIEAARDRIVAAAVRLASEMGIPPVEVALFFNWTRSIRREQESAIARMVVRAVQEGLPPDGETAHLEYRLGGIQPLEVDEILVHRTYLVEQHHWQWHEASHVEKDAVELFTGAIDRKAKRIEIIRTKCDSCWLLMVADPFRASGKIRPNQSSMSFQYVSPFDRVYFLDVALCELARLRTIGSPIAVEGIKGSHARQLL